MATMINATQLNRVMTVGAVAAVAVVLWMSSGHSTSVASYVPSMHASHPVPAMAKAVADVPPAARRVLFVAPTATELPAFLPVVDADGAGAADSRPPPGEGEWGDWRKPLAVADAAGEGGGQEQEPSAQAGEEEPAEGTEAKEEPAAAEGEQGERAKPTGPIQNPDGTTNVRNLGVEFDHGKLRRADRCGTEEKCVISYGLYGSGAKYMVGAVRNMELQKELFPGWTVRFYVDSSVPRSVVDDLRSRGAEMEEIDGLGGEIRGMWWRFLVADDETVDRFIVRDSDSRLSVREYGAVQEWVASGKKFHSIRDHQNHNRPFNGGMWGGTKGCLGEPGAMRKWVESNSRSGYGGDQNFLSNNVWARAQNDIIAHDSFHCTRYPNSHSFPTQRAGPKNKEHVGGVFDEHDVPRAGDMDNYAFNSPPECRRYPEWTHG